MWHYNIAWYKDPALIKSIVTVRSKPRDDDPDNNLHISFWTNFDSSSISIIPSSGPLILYTQVVLGKRGVVGARVSMALQVLSTNGTLLLPGEIVLADDGCGGDYTL